MTGGLPIDESSLAKLVNDFYAKVRDDPLIGPIFNEAIHDWPEHLARLQAFWSSVMLKTGRYDGRPMPAHIRHADRIDESSFNRWLAIWETTTSELFDPPTASDLQDRAWRIAESLRLGILYSKRTIETELGN